MIIVNQQINISCESTSNNQATVYVCFIKHMQQ